MPLQIPTYSPPSFSSGSSDTITLTPRPSFYATDSHSIPDPPTRPSSFGSVDSGYASTLGPQSDLDSMPKDSLAKKRLSPSASRGSLKHKKMLFLQRRKISPNETPLPRTSWQTVDTLQDETDLSNTEDEDDQGDHNMQQAHSLPAFEAMHHFITRRGMIHHPYPLDQAPYMQAYDRTLLDNDRFSDVLLQRLSINGSPSFLLFNDNPPSAILDLGCGAGHWAIRAAKHWPKARIIGIDLIAPSRLNGGIVTPPNVEWRQMNFVGHRLGFPSDMFDLVRMANLSLCIPHESWEDVLSEVERVLAPGGRLELIDDQTLFPTTTPLERRAAASDVTPLPDDSYLELDDSDSSSSDDEESDDDFKSSRSHASSIHSVEEATSYDSASEWSRNDANSKALESMFTDMLLSKHKINVDQRGTIEQSLDTVFGRYNSQRVAAMTLAVAPPASSLDSEPDRTSLSSTDSKSLKKTKGETFKQWISVGEKLENMGKKGDRLSKDSTLSAIPEAVSLKAAGRLGISPSATSPSPSSQSPRSPRSPRSSASPPPRCPRQSPGLILWPSTLIEMRPFELEMHACKHMHSLLGCKAALYDYAEQLYRDADGKPLLDDAMFDDLIWDYECFRRKRFNWRSINPETEMPEEPGVFPNFRHSADLSIRAHPRGSSDASSKQSESSRYSKDELTFVRSIYVYSASKITKDDISLS